MDNFDNIFIMPFFDFLYFCDIVFPSVLKAYTVKISHISLVPVLGSLSLPTLQLFRNINRKFVPYKYQYPWFPPIFPLILIAWAF